MKLNIVHVQAHMFAALAKPARRGSDRGHGRDACRLSHVVAQAFTGVETGNHGNGVYYRCFVRLTVTRGQGGILTTGSNVGEQDEQVLVTICEILSGESACML